jgi:hypothetical protein
MWVWLAGSTLPNQLSTAPPGKIGVPLPFGTPGSRQSPSIYVVESGVFVFGGHKRNPESYLGDLWFFILTDEPINSSVLFPPVAPDSTTGTTAPLLTTTSASTTTGTSQNTESTSSGSSTNAGTTGSSDLPATTVGDSIAASAMTIGYSCVVVLICLVLVILVQL